MLFVLILVTTNVLVTAQTWQLTGVAGFSAGVVNYPSMILDGNGTPFMAYSDAASSNKLTLQKFNGTSWSVVGSAGVSSSSANYIAMTCDNTINVYVAYSDAAKSNKTTVMKHNGSIWSTVGTAGFSAAAASDIAITTDGIGSIYLVYSDAGNSNKLTVQKYNGTSWSLLGSAGFTLGAATNNSIVTDGFGNVFVAYTDAANNSKLTVQKYNGTSWSVLGSAGFSAGASAYIKLATDGMNNVFVAYKDIANSNKATVQKLSGNTWVVVGTSGFTSGAVNYISLAVNYKGVPVIAYSDVANSNKINVMKYVGNWSVIGTGFSTADVSYTSLKFDGLGNLFVGYKDAGVGGGKAVIQKLPALVCSTPTQTPNLVDTAGFTTGGVTYNSIAINGQGTPYIAYHDASGFNTNEGIVRKFDGSHWVDIGTAFASGYGINAISMALDAAGNPYVAFFDYSKSDKLIVKKFNGTNWDFVGDSTGLSPGAISENSIAFDGNGTLYVAYNDFASAKTTVIKYVNGNWSIVGIAGFTPYNPGFISLKINGLGIPHLAFRNGLTYKANVMRFINGVWSAFGGSISNGDAHDISLAIDKKGTMYVAFTDDYYNHKLVVSQNTGTGWNQLVNITLSTGYASSCSMAVDNNGTPYVAFSDDDNNQKATLLKFNGTAWQNLGNGFSVGSCTDTKLAIDHQGKPYVFFHDYINDRGTAYSFESSCPLPLLLTRYNVQYTNEKTIQLKWQTANEINVSHINIQRSLNGKDFTTIGNVNARCCEYSFTDNSLPLKVDGKLYYRLEIVDKDGSKRYSEIRNVELGIRNKAISVYPNPAKDIVNIECLGAKELLIIDNLGRTVYRSTVNSQPLTVNTKQMSKGIFIVKAMMNNGDIKTEKLVVE